MIEAFFDGACDPNPGKNLAYGAVIYKDHSTLPIYTISKKYAYSGTELLTNNVAEYLGCIATLKYLIYKEWNKLPIHIKGDSKLVICQMNGDWGINSGIYKPYAERAFALLDLFPNIEFTHIRREFNTIADELSKLALRT